MKLEPRLKMKKGERAGSILRGEAEAAPDFDPFVDVPAGTWELLERIAEDIDERQIKPLGFRLARLALVNPRIAEVFRASGQTEKIRALVQADFGRKDEDDDLEKTGALRDAADFLSLDPDIRSVIQPYLPAVFAEAKILTVKGLRGPHLDLINALFLAESMLRLYPERQTELREAFRQAVDTEKLLNNLGNYAAQDRFESVSLTAARLRILFPELNGRIQHALKPFWPVARQRLDGAKPAEVLNVYYDLLRDAAVILAEEAYIDEQGGLHVAQGKSRLAVRVPLPVRPEV